MGVHQLGIGGDEGFDLFNAPPIAACLISLPKADRHSNVVTSISETVRVFIVFALSIPSITRCLIYGNHRREILYMDFSTVVFHQHPDDGKGKQQKGLARGASRHCRQTKD